MLRSLFRLPRQLQGKTTPYSPVSFFSSTSQLKAPPASEQEPEHRPSNPAPAAARTKIWSFDSFFDDHTKVFRVLPKLISAYATDPIDPVLNEAVMLTVNSVNDCSYCTGLHGPLAKMAGINQVEIDRLEKGNSTAAAAHESQSATERETRDIVLRYAREFALSSGHDLYSKVRDAEHTTDASANESAGQAQEKLDSMLSEVERVLGTRRKAESINALCWFLHWGSIGKQLNTIIQFAMPYTRVCFSYQIPLKTANIE